MKSENIKEDRGWRRLITAILVMAICLAGCKVSNVKNVSKLETSTEETTEEIKSETEDKIGGISCKAYEIIEAINSI